MWILDHNTADGSTSPELLHGVNYKKLYGETSWMPHHFMNRQVKLHCNILSYISYTLWYWNQRTYTLSIVRWSCTYNDCCAQGINVCYLPKSMKWLLQTLNNTLWVLSSTWNPSLRIQRKSMCEWPGKTQKTSFLTHKILSHTLSTHPLNPPSRHQPTLLTHRINRYEVGHVSQGEKVEPALDWNQPILMQREYMMLNHLFSKALLSKLPIR